MAEQQTGQVINISDIPEEIKPYRRMLLNAAASLAFDPRFLMQQLASNPTGLTGLPGGSNTPTNPTDPNYNYTPTALGVKQGTTSNNGYSINSDALNSLISSLKKSNASFSDPLMSGKSGNSIDALTGSMLGTKGVNLNDVGLPIGPGTYPVNQPVGGGVNPTPIIIGSNGANSPNFNPYAGVPPPSTIPRTPNTYNPGNPGTNNPGTNNPGGGGNPTTPGPNNPTPNQPGGGTTFAPVGTVFVQPGAAGTTGSVGPDYNNGQYLPDNIAAQLAAALGGTVSHTVTGGPNGPPPQNVLELGLGGVGNQLNAGLVYDLLTNPSQAGFQQQRLQDELNYLTRQSNAFQGFQGAPQTFSQYAVDPSQFPRIGNMPTYKKGGLIERLKMKRYAVGGSLPGLDPAAPPTSTTQDTSSYPYAAYTPFSGQRYLDFRDNPANGNLATSQATRAADTGYSMLPSVFDGFGKIQDNRDPVTGKPTTNFGIANDLMDWSGNQVGAAMTGYGDIYNKAMSVGNTSFAPTDYAAPQFSDPTLLSAGRIAIDPLNDYRMQNSLSWPDNGVIGTYMNPYMDAVGQQQRQRAIDDFNEQRGARNSAAVRSGAFGGSRDAVVQGVAERALNRNLQSIDANTLNNAYLQGQQQFNADRSAGFNVNKANLDSALQTQGLATQAGLSAAQSNQATNAQQFAQKLAADQQAEQMRAQYGLQAAQLGDTSRQAAARLGLDAATLGGNQALQAMQGLTNASTAMSSIGATRADLQRLAQQLEQSRLSGLAQSGAAQDARAQGALDYGYQNFQNERNWPFQLANFYAGQLSGVPIGVNQEQVQYQSVSPWSQIGGLATSAIGALGQYAANRNQGS